MSTNPFTLAHKTTVDVLRNSPAVHTAVKNYRKNIIDFTEQRLVTKDKVSEADLPELLVVYEGSLPNFYFSSSHVSVVSNYHIRISTGDQRPDAMVWPVQFAVLSCMCKAFLDDVYQALTWNDRQFVQDVVPTNIVAGFSDPEANRGIKGWVSVFSFTLTMQFARQDLIAFCDGNIT